MSNVKTKEEILDNMYGLTKVAGFQIGMEGRGFKFGVDIDADELAEDVQMLMSKGVTYDDAENVVLCKIFARFAARFQEMHATAAVAIEDYEDESVHPFIKELNMELVGLESSFNQAADAFCGEVFGDKRESPYIEEGEEHSSERDFITITWSKTELKEDVAKLVAKGVDPETADRVAKFKQVADLAQTAEDVTGTYDVDSDGDTEIYSDIASAIASANTYFEHAWWDICQFFEEEEAEPVAQLLEVVTNEG